MNNTTDFINAHHQRNFIRKVIRRPQMLCLRHGQFVQNIKTTDFGLNEQLWQLQRSSSVSDIYSQEIVTSHVPMLRSILRVTQFDIPKRHQREASKIFHLIKIFRKRVSKRQRSAQGCGITLKRVNRFSLASSNMSHLAYFGHLQSWRWRVLCGMST